LRLRRRIGVEARIAAQPSGIISRFAMKKTMNTEYRMCAFCRKIVGPGLTFFRYITPIAIA